MDFSSYFPIWNKLTPTQQQILEQNAVLRKVDKGTVIHNGTVECTGLLLVKSGQLRAYLLSDEGREISLYRLFDRDICLFSASCMMSLRSPLRRRRIPRCGLFLLTLMVA